MSKSEGRGSKAFGKNTNLSHIFFLMASLSYFMVLLEVWHPTYICLVWVKMWLMYRQMGKWKWPHKKVAKICLQGRSMLFALNSTIYKHHASMKLKCFRECVFCGQHCAPDGGTCWPLAVCVRWAASPKFITVWVKRTFALILYFELPPHLLSHCTLHSESYYP